MAGETIIPQNPFEATQPVGPQMFRMLRSQIVRGELTPGIRLSEADLATRYGTSRQPVREAFIKLAEAALIEIRPQRGSYVRRIDLAAVRSALFVRKTVEADIVRHVAQSASEDLLHDLDTMLDRQDGLIEVEDPQPFIAADEAFHLRLAEAAGQRAGWDVLQPLKTQMDRVRHLSVRQFPRRALVRQHADVVEAIRARDPDSAEAHMRNHLRQILEDLPEVIAARPEFFERTST